MRRLYVTHKSVWESPIREGHPMRRHALFSAQTGSHYIDLAEGYILLAGAFDNEWAEEIWSTHPGVSVLPHPTMEGAMKIGDKVKNQVHLEALKSVGIQDQHTVWDAHEVSRKLHPLVRLSNVF